MSSREPRRPSLRAEARHVAGSLVRFGPSPVRWPMATQASVAIAAPVITLALIGRGDLALLSATGAFTLLYGGALTARERAAFLPLVAAGLLGSAALGVGAATLGTAAVVLGLVATAVGAAAVCFGWSVGPPGPIFFALVYGLSAHLTTPVDGRSPVEPVTYLAVLAASSAFAYLVAVSALILPSRRALPPRPLREIFPGPRWDASARTLLVRAVVIAALGAGAALVVDPDRAYWIVSAGIAVLGVSASRRVTLTRGIHRAAGTLGGAAVYLLLSTLSLPVALLGLVLGALQFAIELVVVRHYALALCFITPLVLLIIGSAGSGGAGLAVERVVDTLVGSVVGVLAGLLVPRRSGA